jgi:hypothetical protein
MLSLIMHKDLTLNPSPIERDLSLLLLEKGLGMR